MTDKTYKATGTYKDKGTTKKFMKEVTAVNENYAKEKILAGLGSKHKVTRYAIKIETFEETKE